MSLDKYGWDAFFAESFAPLARDGYAAGRVFLQHNKIYMLYAEAGELAAEVAGKMEYEASGPDDFPAVGDWVAIRTRKDERKATIHEILPRRSKFSRKVAGSRTDEQIVAANVDTLFLVTGLDNDFNLRRIERYLLMASESGARAVVVLNKADVAEDVEAKVREVRAIASDAPVLLMSAKESEGVEQLLPYTGAGQTVSLIGSSGVGKSTIINKLLGTEKQKVSEVRASDERGKHTTTHRELLLLPTGGLIIDTPGMRELQLLVREHGLRDTFEDIEALMSRCYFSDCGHKTEPDCAVREALATGELDAERYSNYQKMQAEMDALAAKQARGLAALKKEKMKKIHQELKKHKKRY
ncbi:MAG TPA: ribosome small subunit-dependent GTPase A [Pyrinomonadaceae bacterium]|nr:ribosome small subunit-dependent GTPase A [Pyrinomonadaceae bacterium]